MAIFASIYAGPPRHYGSTRTDKRYIAIHNTANDATAEGEASYARRREDTVSSHYYVDNDSLLQSLDTDLRAYHAGSTIGNSQAIAYEITGTNGKSRAWWLANVAWALLARQIAADCREHAIEPRLLTVAEIKAGSKTGIITHDQMRQAWGGTTHTDPGANFPLDHLLALVRAELGEDDDMAAVDVWAVKWGSQNAGDRLRIASVDNSLKLDTVIALLKGDDDAASIIAHIDARAAELKQGQADTLAAILAALPDNDEPVSREVLVAALTQVLGSLDGATPPAQG